MDNLKDNEVWIKGFEFRYSINENAVICSWADRNTRRGILKPILQKKSGYTNVSLTTPGRGKRRHSSRLIQSLMRDHFLLDSRPTERHCLTHKDNDFLNNKLDNLKWIPRKEIYSRENKTKGRKQVTVKDLETGETTVYRLTTEAGIGIKIRADLIPKYSKSGEAYKGRYLIKQENVK